MSKLVSARPNPVLTVILLILHPVGIDLHRLFDATKDSKPTGWFWIPTDENLILLTIMHNVYVGGESVPETAGMTANRQCDLKDVCPVLLVLEKS